ncbi:MAG: peptidoglycan editing factor PgeF [Acidobacteriota bacterium]|nr:peptidoglycan editing factor PgeF [Acidobacteriota bacterium]
MPMDTITSQVQNLKSEEMILAEKGFYWRAQCGVKILVCRALEENGFTNGFSTRLGGVSPFPKDELNLAGFDEDTDENIFENRKRFLRVFDNDYQLATAWQVHGDDVKVVKSAADVKDENAKFDALTSNLDHILVGVKTADCVPILIGDAKTKAFAAVHAGWRGTAFSIVGKAIEKMRQEFGTEAENLVCAIGAAATCKNYEIGRDVIDAFRQNFSKSEHLFTPTRSNHALIDLLLANQEQLLAAQVLPENIYVAPFCTMERTDLFFSYRQEKKLYGKTGRLLSVIGRRK